MISAFVSGESLEGLADEFQDELLPQMVEAVDAATEILVTEWKSVASRPEGSGRTYGGDTPHRAAAVGEPLTKRSGAYVDSIAQGTAKKKGHSVRGYAVARVPYAARQEFGGRGRRGIYIPPHPTARVAEKNAEPRMYDAIDRTLGVA